MEPFIKWPGGKRWLADEIVMLTKNFKYKRYIEPFLGGGAVFFKLTPLNAILADINAELINAYNQVVRNPNKLRQCLRRMPVSKKDYYEIRARIPRSRIERAVRFLYLNHTAFSGIYRLNLKGRFNVPFGGGNRTPERLWRSDILVEASKVLSQARFLVKDFEETIELAKEGDVVYCDPTYTVAHNNNGFVKYNDRIFSWSDQIRLARACENAASRGANVIISNACCKEISSLYKGWVIKVLTRTTTLCPRIEKRRKTQEFLIISS